MSEIKQIIMSIFHPLEVVGRGSGTQLQVDKTLNKITQREKGYYAPADNSADTFSHYAIN